MLLWNFCSFIETWELCFATVDYRVRKFGHTLHRRITYTQSIERESVVQFEVHFIKNIHSWVKTWFECALFSSHMDEITLLLATKLLQTASKLSKGPIRLGLASVIAYLNHFETRNGYLYKNTDQHSKSEFFADRACTWIFIQSSLDWST